MGVAPGVKTEFWADMEQQFCTDLKNWTEMQVYHNYISASPTACPLRGYGCAGTPNDCLGEAVMLSTGTSRPCLSMQ